PRLLRLPADGLRLPARVRPGLLPRLQLPRAPDGVLPSDPCVPATRLLVRRLPELTAAARRASGEWGCVPARLVVFGAPVRRTAGERGTVYRLGSFAQR